MAEPNFTKTRRETEPVDRLAYEHAQADYLVNSNPKGLEGFFRFPPEKRKRKNQEKYDALAQAAEQAGVNVSDTFADTSTKIRHLKEIMGYNRLRISSGPKGFVNIEGAKQERIGLVYKECYERAEK